MSAACDVTVFVGVININMLDINYPYVFGLPFESPMTAIDVQELRDFSTCLSHSVIFVS